MHAKKSSFRFSNPKLVKFNYQILDENSEKFDSFDQVETNTQIKRKVTEADDNAREATVYLTVKMGQDVDKKYPFNFDITMKADFTWDDSYNEEIVDNMLKINAPSLLFSYIRPIIAEMTGYGFKTLHLPFIDFSNSNN